jgi:hypothetical protein
MENSLTQVFRRPVQGRQFFEQVIRNNLDLGRPDRIRLLFPQLNRRTPAPPYGYRTRVVTHGVHPSVHVDFKKSHVKQYFKEERALRTETTINDTRDFRLTRGLANFDRLREIGQRVNHRLLKPKIVSCPSKTSSNSRDPAPTKDNARRPFALPTRGSWRCCSPSASSFISPTASAPAISDHTSPS